MRKLIALLLPLFAASVQAMPPPCFNMIPGVNVYIYSLGQTSGCAPWMRIPCEVGETLSFAARAFGAEFGCPHTFVWNFGDGSTAQGREAMHAFNGSGTYAVTVTITNAYNQTVAVTQEIVVVGRPGPPFIAFPLASGGTRVQGGFRFEIIDAAGGGEWIWHFGDGTTARGIARTQTHVYAKPGTYVVTLSSTERLSTYTHTVHVPEPPPRRRSARH